VLARLAAGRSNQRVAGELVVSLDTVNKHVSRVPNKLGAANRTEAVARAGALGLLGQRSASAAPIVDPGGTLGPGHADPVAPSCLGRLRKIPPWMCTFG
jgi:Bacterial regulatory proteins, luxR family